MKKSGLIIIMLLNFIMASSQLPEWPKMKSLKLVEVRTTSDRVLVAYFLGPDMMQVSTDSPGWSLNGKQPAKIDKWITPNWSGIDFGYEHHIYLTMNEPFVQGNKYQLKTPHGEISFTFDSKNIYCESIKTNQSGYSALSKVRYANFAIWNGTEVARGLPGNYRNMKLLK